MATDWLERLFQVSSVFGRTGEVVATLGDYAASLISYSNGSSGLVATTTQDAIDELATSTARKQVYNELATTGLSGAYNALALAGFESYASHSLTAVNFGTATINGITAPGANVNGLVKILRLPYGTFTVTLVHNSGSASAGNKIIMPDGVNITNDQGGSLNDVYVMLTRHNGNWFAQRLGTQQLSFGTTLRGLSTTAPSANQILTSTGAEIVGTAPGAIMPRMTASNSSTAARTFAANVRHIWNGSTTPSFTFSSGSAVDGCVETIFFPASLGLTTFTLSSDLDPTGSVAYAFDSGSAAYRLTMVYLADGPSIVSTLRKVTDL